MHYTTFKSILFFVQWLVNSFFTANVKDKRFATIHSVDNLFIVHGVKNYYHKT